MVRFVFSVEDLARTRFAISPIWELERSLVALRDPSIAALHVPWLRSLSGRLDGLALKSVVALLPRPGYNPDFVTPPPAGPLGQIADDLAALRATPARLIRHDMELFHHEHPRVREAEAWLAHPRRELRRLADTLEAYWERALEPSWPRIREFLDADIAYRARRLAGVGPEALFADLHPAVSWREGGLEVEVQSAHSAEIELGGRGLLLLPSAFAWAGPSVIDRDPWRPTLIYPARGIATLWEDGARTPEGLARLLGATRAAALADLAAPRSTTDLARRLEISPAAASHHLHALREAGLVTAQRDRRWVLYVRTPLGDALTGA